MRSHRLTLSGLFLQETHITVLDSFPAIPLSSQAVIRLTPSIAAVLHTSKNPETTQPHLDHVSQELSKIAGPLEKGTSASQSLGWHWQCQDDQWTMSTLDPVFHGHGEKA